jgi:hypothetical protein
MVSARGLSRCVSRCRAPAISPLSAVAPLPQSETNKNVSWLRGVAVWPTYLGLLALFRFLLWVLSLGVPSFTDKAQVRGRSGARRPLRRPARLGAFHRRPSLPSPRTRAAVDGDVGCARRLFVPRVPL